MNGETKPRRTFPIYGVMLQELSAADVGELCIEAALLDDLEIGEILEVDVIYVAEDYFRYLGTATVQRQE